MAIFEAIFRCDEVNTDQIFLFSSSPEQAALTLLVTDLRGVYTVT